ncbi:MAG: pyruvate formate lyase family protein, partial [Candidatus Thorarchaeota archaeon]
MTSRSVSLKMHMLDSEPTISSERAVLFTDYMKEHESEPMILKLAGAFAHVLDNMKIRIEPGEIIVGNMGPTPRSCQVFPEYSWQWIENELDRFSRRRTEKFAISERDKTALRNVFAYWKSNSTAEIAETKMPRESVAASKAGLFTIGAPGTGIGHVIVDYEEVLHHGIIGILNNIADLRSSSDIKTLMFYDAAEIQLRAAVRFANRFGELAQKLAKEESEPSRKAELNEISRICRKVPEYPAGTFQEALQSFWFIHLLVQTESNGHSISTGRFDQYMYPYYARDIEQGILTKSKATELLELLWVKFTSLIKIRNEYYSVAFAGHPMFQNLTIGGQDKDGNDVSNELTELVLQATKNIRVTQPTVSFRWHKRTPEKYKLQVIDVVSNGLGMPGIFNDDIIMPMMHQKGTHESEVYDYSILGCVEPIIAGKSDPRPNIGYVNIPKILEITLNNGRDPKTGEVVGKRTGDPRTFTKFDQLWNAFQEQIDYSIELLARADRIAANVLAEYKPTPFISSLLEGCL